MLLQPRSLQHLVDHTMKLRQVPGVINERRHRARLASSRTTLADLQTNPPVSLVPQINAKWTELFTWQGQGEMSAAERAKLREIVHTAHEQGRRIRFWEAPDNPAAWKLLLESDVDLINTDDLRGLQRFLARDG